MGFLSMSSCMSIITSRVSGWGYKNGAVCVCVCQLALSQLNRSAYGHEIGTGIGLDNISDEFGGQGQRSRSQGKKKPSFSGFSDLTEQISSLDLWCDVMMSHDVMGSHCDVKWRHITRQHFSVSYYYFSVESMSLSASRRQMLDKNGNRRGSSSTVGQSSQSESEPMNRKSPPLQKYDDKEKL